MRGEQARIFLREENEVINILRLKGVDHMVTGTNRLGGVMGHLFAGQAAMQVSFRI